MTQLSRSTRHTPRQNDLLATLPNADYERLAARGRNERPSTSLGLGLFIARHIVLGHGGTLGVESSAQGGTVFTARFPRTA